MSDSISEQEIDEAVIRIMDFTGVSDPDNGWEFRDLMEYARDLKEILKQFVAREFAADDRGENFNDDAVFLADVDAAKATTEQPKEGVNKRPAFRLGWLWLAEWCL